MQNAIHRYTHKYTYISLTLGLNLNTLRRAHSQLTDGIVLCKRCGKDEFMEVNSVKVNLQDSFLNPQFCFVLFLHGQFNMQRFSSNIHDVIYASPGNLLYELPISLSVMIHSQSDVSFPGVKRHD